MSDLDWNIGTIYRNRNNYKDEDEFRRKLNQLITEARIDEIMLTWEMTAPQIKKRLDELKELE